ncbi:MAG: response regulator transcription factor [Flavobacteriales bacterium]|nr:response regulator transcription factor [Flavobacteriales bacterium]
MKCIVIEDELMARTSLEGMCKKNPSLQLVGSFENAQAALDKLNEIDPDIIFLDIEMPGMNGFELLDVLPRIPQIIFTTSKKEYAFDAFEYDVTDFLNKPVHLSRFNAAVEKAVKNQDRLAKISDESAKKEMYIKHEGRLVRVPYSNILFFESMGDYVKVHTENNVFVFYGTIKSLDKALVHARFFKVHRTYIINLDKIVDIEDNTLVIHNKVIPISRAHKPLLLRHLNII